MSSNRISFTNFDRRLVVAGGREQTGPAALRRASGVAPELTTSVLSRWGSMALYSVNAIQCYYWNGDRYQYDGAALYKNGVSIVAGFNGGRISFNSMAPQIGLPDYLFILGGGVTPFKIDPSGNITNWGIVQPPNLMNGSNLPNEQIVIDSFVGSAANYTATGCSTADESTIVAVGAGSLKINPSSAGAYNIQQAYGAALNLENYASGDFSLNTDVFQFWIYINAYPSGTNTIGTWLEMDFDVNDQSFKKDWYSISIGLLPSTTANPRVRHNVNFDVVFQVGQWQQITVAKSQFLRNGTNLQLDWSMVQAIQIKGGNFLGTGDLYLDNLTLSGGSAMGAGPAVGAGGSEYDYYTVFRNVTTGSQSNPQDTPTKVFGVAVNQVQLTNIPVSADPQVGARDLYRTAALTQPGGGLAYYLDTIYDNTTTTYTDSIADFAVPIIQTPWIASIAVPPSTPTFPSTDDYYVDGGNGYYFLLTTPGTTGTQPPQWKIPSVQWAAQAVFNVGDTSSQPHADGHFWIVTTGGISGLTEPNWAGGGPITDGTVVWTDQGVQVTTDNTAAWTFQGINATDTLSSDGLEFDNAPPESTYNDAIGPYQGSMLWTRDTAQGRGGYVYMSPPGQPESVALALLVSTVNDSMQKLTIWDGVVWAISNARAYQSNFTVYPQFAFMVVDDSLGTLNPDTVIPVKLTGIVYWAPDGIRILNWGGSQLIGFRDLSPIFRGQPEENLPAWNETTGPVWAEEVRNEVIFSDGTTLTIGMTFDGGAVSAWRQPGPILTAGYYEHQTGEFQVAFGGEVYLFESPGALADGETPIAFELQSPGDMPDAGAEFTGQRLYLTINMNVSGVVQILTPTLIIDGVENVLPKITNMGRSTIELPISKFHGRLFDGIRLDGTLTGRVEIFRLEADVWMGEQQEEQ